jgi:hypothetical protein
MIVKPAMGPEVSLYAFNRHSIPSLEIRQNHSLVGDGNCNTVPHERLVSSNHGLIGLYLPIFLQGMGLGDQTVSGHLVQMRGYTKAVYRS